MDINEATKRLKTMCISTVLDLEDDDYAQIITHQEDADALRYAINALEFKEEYQTKIYNCLDRIKEYKDFYIVSSTTINEIIKIIEEELGVE